MSILVVDGAQGEGGGQVLRTSLALSMVTGTPFRIERIRAGRPKPGLLRQHLTSVRAAAEICGATVRGDELGSKQLVFEPGPVRAGEFQFSIGSAGSTTLVLQTILPALLTATERSTVTLEGGTHNPSAPPFDFLERAFLPLICRMGPSVSATLECPGFFPAGGGRFRVEVDPVAALQPLELLGRGELRQRTCRIWLAGLPRTIAEREWRQVSQRLHWPDECLDVRLSHNGRGPGNVVELELGSEFVTEVFTAFGRKHAPSEQVADEAVEQVRDYLQTDVAVGEHLADQLLLPMALAGCGSFTTLPLSHHAKTNIDVVRRFSDVPIEVTDDGLVTHVTIGTAM